MARLTKHYDATKSNKILNALGIENLSNECIQIIKCKNELCSETCERVEDCEHCPIEEAICKLAEYEDAEEQGLLRRLPCKVGDAAYYVHKGGIDKVEVDSFIVNVNLFVNVSLYIGCDRFGKTLTPYKTLFFTKEEAEAALQKMQEDK